MRNAIAILGLALMMTFPVSTVTGGGSLSDSPTLFGLEQFDGSTSIPEGWILRHPYISSFSANVSDPDGDQVKLQVELRRFEEPFTGIDDGGILTSDPVPSGSENVRVTRFGLSDGKYHWRARAIGANSNTSGTESGWQEFGVVGNVDFSISAPFEPTQPLYGQYICEAGSLDKENLIFITHVWN